MWHQYGNAAFDYMFSNPKRSKEMEQEILDTYNVDCGAEIHIIGHSGGGLIAYQVAKRLANRHDIEVQSIIRVGSPKRYIHRDFRERVIDIYAEGDYIYKGSYLGGKPTRIEQINIGGDPHMDYFIRGNVPTILDVIWGHLRR